ncbi:uncharacterized protein LOC132032600 [Lycium ferocissimum]|uniref:uncharacterized protein LOC132032600 n=1 Tax=Lycium ferocissimum TaxID=112874 RepID=UPI00281662A6|nr:uncharacterized protein LOC132032600 [Lycium ferocissimum]XP_059278227.1 uncharacterized protein LOC132032600 [Lycium ferocissimum]
MTMINPSQNLSKQNLQSSVYVYGFGDYKSYSLMNEFAQGGYERYSRLQDCLGSDLALIGVPHQNSSMAEDESRTGSINETGSSSKDNIHDTNNNNNIREKAKDKVEEEEDQEKGWLQLSIGGHTYLPTNNKPEGNPRRSGGLVELDLLPADGMIGPSSEQGTSTNVCTVANFPAVHTFPHHHNIHEFRAPPPPRTPQLMTTPSTTSSLFLQHPGGGTSSTMFQQQYQQEIINWGFRPMQPIQHNFNLSLVSAGSHFGSGLGIPAASSHFGPGLGVPGPSSIDFRVIHPPRRPHSGLWFSLQPSSNQTKEPFLQQISKSYLRIKDGRMTIRLVLKYLVNKLQLENESEIEITCRGQQLQPFLTLQHVRDHIWSTNAADNILTLLPSETSNHVMVLHYGRSAAQN